MVDWGKVAKKDHLVLVIPRKKLFGQNNERYFQGFSNDDFTRTLNEHLGFLSRGLTNSRDAHVNDGIFAESDQNYQQLIPYVIVVNKETQKVYAYQRGSNQVDVHDARLHGNWSWGVGGHVDFQDEFFVDDLGDFLKENMKRELDEEIELQNGRIHSVQLIGFLNDDSDAVGRVHFGLIFIAETSSTDISPKDKESVQGKFLSIQELQEIANTPGIKCDNWSRIVLPALGEFLATA